MTKVRDQLAIKDSLRAIERKPTRERKERLSYEDARAMTKRYAVEPRTSEEIAAHLGYASPTHASALLARLRKERVLTRVEHNRWQHISVTKRPEVQALFTLDQIEDKARHYLWEKNLGSAYYLRDFINWWREQS